MKQALEALDYLHACGIMHRDIKPENILVELEDPVPGVRTQSAKRIKITDFGLSKIVTSRDQVTDCCGTPAYVAPEILQKTPYHKQVDIWALGVVFYLMVAKVLPFQHVDKKQTFKLIKKKDPDFSLAAFADMSQPCVDLIQKMLTKDPEARITVQQALAHRFFDQLDPNRPDEYGAESSDDSLAALAVEATNADGAQKIEDAPLQLQDPPQRNRVQKKGQSQPTQKPKKLAALMNADVPKPIERGQAK